MQYTLTGVQSIGQLVKQVGESGDRLDLLQDISVYAIPPFQNVKQLFLHFGRCDVIGIKLGS
jgi:hypothetical protein